MYILETHDLYRFYHTGESETLALRGVSIAVAAGELVAVIGPSGSGKSTLMACIAGLDEPSAGMVELCGQRMSRRPEADRAALRAAHIGMLLQHGNLFPQLTLEANLWLQLRLVANHAALRIDQVLTMVGLAHRRRAYPAQLSGGELARAGLGVALVAQPALLLADEPTAEVDAETEQYILNIFNAHRANGGAALIVTHSEPLAAQMDRVIQLRDGSVFV